MGFIGLDSEVERYTGKYSGDGLLVPCRDLDCKGRRLPRQTHTHTHSSSSSSSSKADRLPGPPAGEPLPQPAG